MSLKLESFETYKDSSISLIKKKLVDHYGHERLLTLTLEDIKKDIKELNAYSGIDDMKEVDHKEIFIINDDVELREAEQAVLEGRVFWEHAAAGEATRLGMGTKYLIK